VKRNVKRRSYRSERRDSQAEGTRRAVLEAAARLFVEKGFEGTSINAVAGAAGVSPETVYARFGTKRALLGEAAQLAVRGEDPRPVREQSGPRAVMAENDQRRQIELFAADIARRIERAGPLVAVVGASAGAHQELRELHERLHSDRRRNLRAFVDALAANGPLAMSPDRATESVWALTTPELHSVLTGVGGWSRRRYVGWLADSLISVLLP
jgi:AcrR family transcriptional regulator